MDHHLIPTRKATDQTAGILTECINNGGSTLVKEEENMRVQETEYVCVSVCACSFSRRVYHWFYTARRIL